MKAIFLRVVVIAIFLAGIAAPAWALDKPELDHRIRQLAQKLEAMQAKPDKRIPPKYLQEALGIVLLDQTKGGLGVGYQAGGGLAMVRESKSAAWSPVGFMRANEGSLGFQIGGQRSFMVILLTSTNATKALGESAFAFGGEARGTAGSSTAKEGGNVTDDLPSMLIYDDVKGLFGGAAIKGGTIAPDEKANQTYYGQHFTMRDILFEKKVEPTEAAKELVEKVRNLGTVSEK